MTITNPKVLQWETTFQTLKLYNITINIPLQSQIPYKTYFINMHSIRLTYNNLI